MFRISVIISATLVLLPSVGFAENPSDSSSMNSMMSTMMSMMNISTVPTTMPESIDDTSPSVQSEIQWGGTCSSQNLHAVYELIQSCNCRPRPQVLRLDIAGDFRSLPMPGSVLVKRCAGWCPSFATSCLPMETSHVELPVWNLFAMNCGVARVQQHQSCSCRCPIAESDCDPAVHRFDADLCRCRCRAAPENCGAGHVWDGVSCRCVCLHQRRHCSTGYGWSDEYCRCMMLMPTAADNEVDVGY